MLWIILAGLTGFAALCALVPLARRAPASATPTQFYRQQLGEIDRDLDRGHLGEQEAADLRTEASRRLLASDNAQPYQAPGGRARRRLAAVALVAFVPVVGLGLYSQLGRPDLPDMPLATRPPSGEGAINVDETLAKMEAHSRAAPDDAKGWSLLGASYTNLRRYEEASHAYSEALRIEPDNALWRANYGEALVGAGNGLVSAEARQNFERALAAKPDIVKARYFLASALEQDGDKPGAIAAYEAMLKDAPPEPQLFQFLHKRIAALKGEPLPPDLSARQMAENPTAAMTPDERDRMIRGMVDGLAARLQKDRKDPNGWLRLIRAYSVLKESDKAASALAQARAALSDDAPSLKALDDLARELNVGG